jgi:hypothetical protein
MKKNAENPANNIKSEYVDRAIQKAWGVLKNNRNSDGGWGRIGGDESDLWNTSFVLDCLTEVYKDDEKYEIRDETKDHKSEIKSYVNDFLDRSEKTKSLIDKGLEKEEIEKFEKYIINFFETGDGIKEKEIINHKTLTIYALAHSVSVLTKMEMEIKTNQITFCKDIVKYLICDEVINVDGGWGWDEYSSSNIYGTAIIVNALMNCEENIRNKNKNEDKKLLNNMKRTIYDGIKWIINNRNSDEGWGVVRGSDPKHTALVLLTLLRFLEWKNNLGEGKKELEDENDNEYRKRVLKYIEESFNWLTSEWPRDEKSRFFRIQSKIPERGWRVEESRHIDRVGFEPTAYAMLALLELGKCEEFSCETSTIKRALEQFIDGFLWILHSQRENGCWHEYEDENGKIGGDCTNFNLALGIMILSKWKKEYKEENNRRKFLEGFVRKDLALLALLSTFEDSFLLTKPEKPRIIGGFPLSVVLSVPAIIISELMLIFIYFEKEKMSSIIKHTFIGTLGIILVVIVLTLIIVFYIWGYLTKKTYRMRRELRKFISSAKGIVDRVIFHIKKLFFNLFTHKRGFGILDNAIQTAWEALILSQNPEGGWGRFRGNRRDLWNTSFILDCLLEFYEYKNIKKEIKKPVEYVAQCCEIFLQNINKNEKEEIEEIKYQEIPTNYALAHSASALIKTGNKTHMALCKDILKYLINDEVRNKDGGWGWDEYSSSDVYGTAIIVNELLDCKSIISQKNRNKNEKLLNEMEKASCEGIRWIIQNQNSDGGWGAVRGSDPKHTALALLTILRFLEEFERLKNNEELQENKHKNTEDSQLDRNSHLIEKYEKIKKNFEQKCEKLEMSIPEYLEDVLDWFLGKQDSYSKSRNRFKIPGKGWRVADSIHPYRAGFESTAYVIWILMELAECKEFSARIRDDTSRQELIDKHLKDSCEWLGYTQGWNGYWHKYEDKNGRMGGGCANFYQALGIQVLSQYKTKEFAKKKFLGDNLDEFLEKDLILLAKLSTARYSRSIAKPKRPYILKGYPLSFVLSYLAALIIGSLSIIFIYLWGERILDFAAYINENPLLKVVTAAAGLLSGALYILYKFIKWLTSKE